MLKMLKTLLHVIILNTVYQYLILQQLLFITNILSIDDTLRRLQQELLYISLVHNKRVNNLNSMDINQTSILIHYN